MKKPAIKIAVAGTHSTGKSTFLSELRRRIESEEVVVGRVSDLATKARDLGFPILSEHTFESTMWIIAEGVRNELELGLHSDVVLVDRPVLDAVGYLDAALKRRGEELVAWQRKTLDRFVQDYTNSYAITVVTELDSSVEIGPDRDDDGTFRVQAGIEIERISCALGRIDHRLSLRDRSRVVDAVCAEVAGLLTRPN